MLVGLTMPGSLAHSVTSNPSAALSDFTVSSGAFWAEALEAANARAQVIQRRVVRGRSMIGVLRECRKRNVRLNRPAKLAATRSDSTTGPGREVGLEAALTRPPSEYTGAGGKLARAGAEGGRADP